MSINLILFVLYVLFNNNITQSVTLTDNPSHQDVTTITQKSDWGDDDLLDDDSDDKDKK